MKTLKLATAAAVASLSLGVATAAAAFMAIAGYTVNVVTATIKSSPYLGVVPEGRTLRASQVRFLGVERNDELRASQC